MFIDYKAFNERRKEIQETYDGFAVILEKFGGEMLSYEGTTTCEAYEIMNDAAADALFTKEFVKEVASKVCKLNNAIKDLRAKGETQDADEMAAVRDIILRYIFDNCDDSITTEYEEFCVPYPKKRTC